MYTQEFTHLLDGGMTWTTDTIKVMLANADCTCASQPDVAVLTDFTTLGRWGGSNYSDQTLGGKSVDYSGSPDFWANAKAADFAYSNIGADGLRDAIGLLIYRDLGGDASNEPIAWIDESEAGPGLSPFPFSLLGGGTVDIEWSSGVVLRVKRPA